MIIKMLSETCYVSCNCNQTPTAADWGKNNLICYAACNAVLIYNPEIGGGKVIATLTSHTKRVNSVKWLSGDKVETELVSGSSDADAIVWSLRGSQYVPSILKGHESNVNLVDGLYKAPDRSKAVVVTVSMDSTVKIWHRDTPSDEFLLSQSLNYGYSLCVGIGISFLPATNIVILACALDNSTIQLYVEDCQEMCKFNKSASLKGHEDWVRGLDFTVDDKGELILASCSQDLYIRIWRISEVHLDETKRKLNVEDFIKTKDKEYRIYVDSILTGHEGWVYSVKWNSKSFQLLSASLDKTMVIWELDSENDLWLEKIRVGEVGGNTLGFYGGLFSPSGDSILAYSYHGAFHIWRNNNNNWEPQVTIGGHFAEVTDLAWEPQGEFIMSISADQTTRIHAPWSKSDEVTWHEIARPQIHGYDLSSLAILSRYKFASSAEEKVIRTFQAPGNFVKNFKRICNIHDDGVINTEDESGPKGASVPSLGLSNKAVFSNDNSSDKPAGNSKDPFPEESHFTAINLTEPPTEETLLQNTLWPEIQKLYGHGYEVYSLALSPDGKFLASACKATTVEHAAVLLWDTSSWKQVQKLLSHSLTVAQLAFSPDSQHLLSVSRDRRWSLFSKTEQGFELVATTDKKTAIHTRIIWCCSWSHDSRFFATGSRDGKVVVWTRNANKIKDSVLGEYESVSVPLLLKNESVTAVAFAPDFISNSYLIAVGLECGQIHLYKWTPQEWLQVSVLDKSSAHHLTVKRLAFRPVLGRAGHVDDSQNVVQLASCGADHCVKIHNILLNKLNK